MEHISKETIGKIRSVLAGQGISPTTFIISVTVDNADHIAAVLGAKWMPDKMGRQRIWPYLIWTDVKLK